MKTRAASASHRASRILTGVTLCALLIAPATPFAAASEANDAAAQGDIQGNATPLTSQLASSSNDEKAYQDEHGDAAAFDELPSPLAASQLSREVALQPLAEGQGVPLVADALAGKPTRFVNQEVSLDGEASVLGSFTIDGMTYAVTGESTVELVAVTPAALADDLVAGLVGAAPVGSDGASSGEDSGSGVPPRSVAEQVPSGASSPQPSSEEASSDGPEGEEAPESVTFEVPESVGYDGVTYSVTSIGPRAFVSCDADVVRIPASVASVDEAAFRGSSVGGVEVAGGNPHLASYEGVLYDVDLKSLLLIPEGKQGAVRIPKTAEVVPADAFSHCASVTAIEADAGSAAFSSRNEIPYDVLHNEASRSSIHLSSKIMNRATHYPKPSNPIRLTLDSTGGNVILYSYRTYAWNYDGNYDSSFSNGSRLRDHYVTGMSFSNQHNNPVHNHLCLFSYGYEELSGDLWFWNQYIVKLLPTADLGNSFVRWELDGKRITKNSPTPLITDTEPHTLTAVFAPNHYTIRFDSHGGSEASDIATTSDSEVTFPTSTRPDYELVGWNTAEDGSGRMFTPGTTLNPGLTRKADDVVTLHAIWKAPEYSITYDLDGGEFGDGAFPTSYTPEDEVAIGWPIRAGYEFLGWSETLFGDDVRQDAIIPAGTKGDLSFLAHWSDPIKYQLGYDLGGGSFDEEPPKSFTCEDSLPIPSPCRNGYAFLGWTEGAASEPSLDYVVPLGTTRDLTLTAHWSEPIAYTIRFLACLEPETGDPCPVEIPDMTLTVEDPAQEVPSVAREGYILQGWSPKAMPSESLVSQSGGKWILNPAQLHDGLVNPADNLVTLVARWSSVLSVDVPSLATFLYDLSRFDPDEPRTAYAEGGARFLNRSAADLRVSGLESRRGEVADALSLADPSPGGTKVLAAFPDEEGTSASLDAAKGPAGALPAHAVSFSLDDVLLEAAFDPMAWKVPASGMLEVGYRLNLGEGASLDPSALLASGALPDGANHGPGVTIATITYCFALA